MPERSTRVLHGQRYLSVSKCVLCPESGEGKRASSEAPNATEQTM